MSDLGQKCKSITENLQEEEVIKLLISLGADRYENKSTYILFPTICHNVDASSANMKLYYYKDTHIFYCYTNCDGMDIFKFLKTYYETRQIDFDWYEDVFKVAQNCSLSNLEFQTVEKVESKKDRYKRREEYILKEYPSNVLDIFIKNYPIEWLNDGITKEAMDKFNIKYWISENKIIIPHYDVRGRLVGIRSRALNEEDIEKYGKYMPIVVEGTWYKHKLSMNLYGLAQNIETIKKEKICYLCESEKAVLQCENFSLPNCAVAVCGSQFNKFQLDLLLRYCKPREIVICFDNEEVGNDYKYFNKLYNLGKKYCNYCNFSFIYDRDGLTNLKDSPTDKGEEIFKKLLERRVHIK